MLYFAYGSNMHPGNMRKRCPGCTFVAAARLREYRLAFSRLSTSWRGWGVADIQPAPGSIVEGVIWDIADAHRDTLDTYEDYPAAYIRKDVVAETFDGRTRTAFAYVARPAGSCRPSRRYLQQIIEGAKAHGLSPGYIAFLEAVPTED